MESMVPKTKSTYLAILKQAATQWSDDNALRLSAALAYYSIFSIAPLLVIVVAISGRLFGPEAAQGLLSQQLHDLVGSKAAEGIEGMVQSANKPASSLVAGIMGAVTLLLGASGVFGELKDALNTIWKVKAKPGQGIMKYVRERLLSFGMVLVIGLLLLISLTLTTALAGATAYFGSAFPLSSTLVAILGFALSYGVITLLFAAIFKILPDAKVRWKEVWIGAAVTGLLFEIGKFLLGFYLARESTASAYGAATSVVLLLLWVYYATLILLFGAEFTQAYALATGSKIEPAGNAEPVTAETRLQQGLEPVSAAPFHGDTSALDGPAKEHPRMVLGLVAPKIEPVETPGPVGRFIAANPAVVMVGSLGGGLIAGLVLRQFEGRPTLSPADQIRTGTKALALAGAAAAATYLSRAKTRAEDSAHSNNMDIQRGLSIVTRYIGRFARSKLRKLF